MTVPCTGYITMKPNEMKIAESDFCYCFFFVHFITVNAKFMNLMVTTNFQLTAHTRTVTHTHKIVSSVFTNNHILRYYFFIFYDSFIRLLRMC